MLQDDFIAADEQDSSIVNMVKGVLKLLNGPSTKALKGTRTFFMSDPHRCAGVTRLGQHLFNFQVAAIGSIGVKFLLSDRYEDPTRSRAKCPSQRGTARDHDTRRADTHSKLTDSIPRGYSIKSIPDEVSLPEIASDKTAGSQVSTAMP